MKYSFFLFFSFFLFILFSCDDYIEEKMIASVNDNKLLLSEVIKDMPQHTVDSSFFVQHYMNDWIRKELMLYHAEINLGVDIQDYNKQIEEYRSSLLIYAYQKQLIDQNFDTTIVLDSIIGYYDKYKQEFKLNKNIFMGRYIVVDKSAPKIKKLSKWYYSNKKQAVIELEDYCKQFANEYYLADSNWQYFSLITSKVPQIKDEEYFLRRNKNIYFEDEQYLYYIYIRDYKIKGSISPLSLEKEKIRNVLLNKNKIKYLKKLEDELYQNGLDLKKIKIY